MIRSGIVQQEKNMIGSAERKLLKVLLIEDSRDYSEMMCGLLRFLGHDALCAPNGIEGIKKAKEYAPDVIICDIGLPGISGYETARRIRKDAGLKDAFLVALTGYAGELYSKATAEAGFDRHTTKPVAMETLKDILRAASGS